MKCQVIFVFLLAVVWTAAKTEDEANSATKDPGAILAALGRRNANNTRSARQPRDTKVTASEKECTKTNKQAGVCVPYYLCQIHDTNDPDKLIDVKDIENGTCKAVLDVCCLPSRILKHEV